MKQMYKLGRSNSLKFTRDEKSTPETLRQPSNILPLTNALEPAAPGRVQRSLSSRLSPRMFSGDAVVAEPESYSLAGSTSPSSFSTISSSLSLSNRQDQPKFDAPWEDRDNRSLRSEAFSESTSRQPSIFSVVSPSRRTSITQCSLDTPPALFHSNILGIQSPTWDRHSIAGGDEEFPTPTGSPHTSRSIQSFSATPHNSAQHRSNTKAIHNQDWKEDIFQPKFRREPFDQPQSDAKFRGYSISAESQPSTPQGEHQNAPKSPQVLHALSRSNTFPASAPAPPPPMALPPPLKHEMIMHGEIRM